MSTFYFYESGRCIDIIKCDHIPDSFYVDGHLIYTCCLSLEPDNISLEPDNSGNYHVYLDYPNDEYHYDDENEDPEK